MEQPISIPSSAFLKIGQQLAVKILIPIPSSAFLQQLAVNTSTAPIPIREPVQQICIEIASYDILKEWAHALIEYFGEYASPFM